MKPIKHIFTNQEDWLDGRLGIPSASRFSEATGRLKNGRFSQAALDYAIELVSERLTGQKSDKYCTPQMLWGVNCEQLAVQEFECRKLLEVRRTPFEFYTKEITTGCVVGCTPDGLVQLNDKERILEIKCPSTTTHIRNFLEMTHLSEPEIPEQYLPQLNGQMFIMGLEAYFVSYDPRLPDASSFACLKHIKICEKLEEKLIEFCLHANQLEEKLK